MTDIKHPEVQVQLTGQDGNAMAIMARVAQGLRRGGYAGEVDAYMEEAMSGDYDNVLQTSMRWVSVS